MFSGLGRARVCVKHGASSRLRDDAGGGPHQQPVVSVASSWASASTAVYCNAFCVQGILLYVPSASTLPALPALPAFQHSTRQAGLAWFGAHPGSLDIPATAAASAWPWEQDVKGSMSFLRTLSEFLARRWLGLLSLALLPRSHSQSHRHPRAEAASSARPPPTLCTLHAAPSSARASMVRTQPMACHDRCYEMRAITRSNIDAP